MHSFTLGPFTVADGAILQLREPGACPALRFSWRGRDCAAELNGTALRLASCAARVPSSAEPGADRDRAFAALARLPQGLPSGWRLQLLPDHRIRVEAEAQLDSPPTAARLIATMVSFALALDPHLDEMESLGLR